MVIGAQLCSAFQMVFEEKLLTGGPKTPAKKVVGMEGFWGCLIMAVVLTLMSTVVPGSDAGHYESAPEGLYMLAHSPALLALVPSYMCSVAVYSLTGIVVGKRMGTVVRCLVDSSRIVVVWAMNLFLYYYVSEDLGAPWAPHAWLTVLGFALLICGTLLYNEVLRAPGCLRRSAGGEACGQEEHSSA
uniref:Uncharacterized protein n=1 Tax=Zooxanthella nutricula TaxID=1333877 RepID=A0A7S2VQF7_9DINO